jgi:hypothetical protein
VAPSPLRERLEATFRFDASDLDANRSGRLSARQGERFRAARGAARVVLAMFAVAVVGSGLFVAWSLPPEQLAVAVGGLVAALGVGLAVSFRSILALGARSVSTAEGLAEADAEGRLRLGDKTLALAAPAHLDAFEPGAAYRVFYVAGPRAIVLSAEALDERGETTPPPEPADPARDPIVVLARRARWIPVAIVALSAQMVGAILSTPGERQLPVFLALVAEGMAFATFGVWWLGRQR